MGSIFNFLKYNRYIRRAIKAEYLLDKLKYLFGGREFRQDWIGRVYTVVNPNVDNISDNGNTIIFDGGEPMIERWLMDNINIMSQFITSNNLFDVLTYKINKLDDDDNYLIILQNVFYDSAKKELKWILFGSLILSIIAIALFIIL